MSIDFQKILFELELSQINAYIKQENDKHFYRRTTSLGLRWSFVNIPFLAILQTSSRGHLEKSFSRLVTVASGIEITVLWQLRAVWLFLVGVSNTILIGKIVDIPSLRAQWQYNPLQYTFWVLICKCPRISRWSRVWFREGTFVDRKTLGFIPLLMEIVEDSPQSFIKGKGGYWKNTRQLHQFLRTLQMLLL